MKGIKFWMFIILVTGFSCTKDNSNDDECLETGIQGVWLWIKTEGGLSGETITPDNSGYTKRLEIDDTIWKEFINDSLTKQSQYIFHVDTSSNFTRGWIEFNTGSNPFAQISGCNLTLICGFEDCPSHTYKRKK